MMSGIVWHSLGDSLPVLLPVMHTDASAAKVVRNQSSTLTVCLAIGRLTHRIGAVPFYLAANVLDLSGTNLSDVGFFWESGKVASLLMPQAALQNESLLTHIKSKTSL